MRNQVLLNIAILTGLIFVLSLLPFAFVDAAKFQSGVTINAPSMTQTETVCDDGIDNDNDTMVDANDQDCAAAAGTAAGTCGLEIISGVPINYGQLNLAQVSNEQKVTYKNVGTATAQVLVKGSNWIGGTADNPIVMQGSGHTRVAITAGMEFAKKLPLQETAKILGELGPGQTGESYWSMYVDKGMSGSPHQDVTLDLTC